MENDKRIKDFSKNWIWLRRFCIFYDFKVNHIFITFYIFILQLTSISIINLLQQSVIRLHSSVVRALIWILSFSLLGVILTSPCLTNLTYTVHVFIENWKTLLRGPAVQRGGSWPNCKPNMWKNILCGETFWKFKFSDFFSLNLITFLPCLNSVLSISTFLLFKNNSRINLVIRIKKS